MNENNDLNGILLIDKPSDWTSFDVIAKLRGILKTRKIGHTGTLDPMATGVLVTLVGKATKLQDKFENQDKTYLAGFQLGITTNTQDITGEITANSDKIIQKEDILKVIPKFTGKQEQIPPMFSAVKIKGQKLYKLARKGIEIEREPKNIEVYRLQILEYESGNGILEIECSKGTYVRTLIHDIGNALGCGGTMTSLRRTMACGFSIDECHTLEEVQNNSPEDLLVSA